MVLNGLEAYFEAEDLGLCECEWFTVDFHETFAGLLEGNQRSVVFTNEEAQGGKVTLQCATAVAVEITSANLTALDDKNPCDLTSFLLAEALHTLSRRHVQ